MPAVETTWRESPANFAWSDARRSAGRARATGGIAWETGHERTARFAPDRSGAPGGTDRPGCTDSGSAGRAHCCCRDVQAEQGMRGSRGGPPRRGSDPREVRPVPDSCTLPGDAGMDRSPGRKFGHRRAGACRALPAGMDQRAGRDVDLVQRRDRPHVCVKRTSIAPRCNLRHALDEAEEGTA